MRASLAIVGMDEDFAGALSIPLYKISTDPSGDTVVTTTESLSIEVEPVVDAVSDLANIQIVEDTATPLALDLNSLLGDDDVAPNQGVESITAIRFPFISYIWRACHRLYELSGQPTARYNSISRCIINRRE